jgi:hypothetical protein
MLLQRTLQAEAGFLLFMLCLSVMSDANNIECSCEASDHGASAWHQFLLLQQ